MPDGEFPVAIQRVNLEGSGYGGFGLAPYHSRKRRPLRRGEDALIKKPNFLRVGSLRIAENL